MQHARVVDEGGCTEVTLDLAAIERLRDAPTFFWLDVRGPSEEELELLGDVFALHPLALEDSLHFGQRPKLELYEGFVLLVLFGHAPDEDDVVEVHVYLLDGGVVTVRRDRASSLRELQRVYGERGLPAEPVALVYAISDALVDSFFPALNEFEDRLELMEDDLVRAPKESLLQDLFTMRRRIARLRRVLGPQRDVVGRLASGTARLPGMTLEHEHYFRDVFDHLLRLNELMEVLRDLMTSAVDVYLSSSSNRLNVVIKQLTVIATIFLPLVFVTGFFGQNFAWMVEHVSGLVAFLVWAIGVPVAAVAVLFVYGKQHGWF